MIGIEDDKVFGCPRSILSELLTKFIPDEAHSDLIKPVAFEKIESTILSIDGEKALGLDGFIALFSELFSPSLEVMLLMLSYISFKPAH